MSDKIEYIEMRFTDILGQLKAMTVPCRPADTLDEVAKDSALQAGTSCDGSSVAGLASVESSDLRLTPDPSSLIELPLRAQRTAAVMCFIHRKSSARDSKEYYPLDTRGRLHKVCEDLLPGKLQLKVKVEPEFNLIEDDGEPFDYAQYADTHPKNPGMDVLLDIASSLREVGISPRVIHHEVGMSQQEIELDFDDVRKMADGILIFKNLTRTVARNQGLNVTFMPKPYPGSAGNGLHCHIQLWDGDKNLFGEDGQAELSEKAKMFVAGLLEHAPAITALANPSVNSYKRLVPHHEAPVYITWGRMNRTALVRVPMFESSEKVAVEFRSGDSMSNPYLLFISIIAAGMDGVKRELTPPPERGEDIFDMTDEEREKLGITTLPTTLGEALDALETDDVIVSAIGNEIAKSFIALKRKEWEDYISNAVTDWEWELYRDR
ncbi:MAG: glutamine synthetase family protein [Candidatus Thorarchaeota archaeon]|nr:MAG: glutamine synthetase [Candidatus Thorarchaeota archaeon]RLI57650.1 MAG: glutamine synthetase [Candidatus Thorarchaeota archaeon]